MPDDKKTLKFQMMMSPSEAQELDNWMFENRIRSRAEAIRRLCQSAMNSDPFVQDGLREVQAVRKYLFEIGDKIVEMIETDEDIEKLLGQFFNGLSELNYRLLHIEATLDNATLTEGIAKSPVLQHMSLEERFEIARQSLKLKKK